MVEVYTSPFTVTLASAYTAGSGTLSVSGAAPVAVQSGTFRVRLANLSKTVLKVTAGAATTTWTVTAESSDANAASGATVYGCEFSPGALDQIRVDQVQSGAFASATPTKAGNLYVPTDSPYLMRDSGSAFSYFLPPFGMLTPPSLASLTTFNNPAPPDSIGISYASGALALFTTSESGNNNYASGVGKAKIASTFTVETAVSVTSPINGTYGEAGLYLSDGTNVVILAVALLPGGVNFGVYIFRLTGGQSFTSAIGNFPGSTSGGTVFLRIIEDATNRYFYASTDGITWKYFASTAVTDFLSTTQYGMFLRADSNTGATFYHFKESNP